MKRFEMVSSKYLSIRTPVIIRVDGKAFHTFTKGFKAFDSVLRQTMVEAARKTSDEMQGFKLAYHQSDEVSFLLTDYETITTASWFDYNVQKIVSVSASAMTAWFNRLLAVNFADNPEYEKLKEKNKIAYFDARAFNVPKEDVSNYFLWRAKDWERNSISMYCRQFFSSKQLFGKKRTDMHEMLHGIGKNWTNDLSEEFKNGTFLLQDGETSIQARYENLSALIEPLINHNGNKE